MQIIHDALTEFKVFFGRMSFSMSAISGTFMRL